MVLCLLPQNDILNNHEKLGEPFSLYKAPYLVVRDGHFEDWHRAGPPEAVARSISLRRLTIGHSFLATIACQGLTGARIAQAKTAAPVTRESPGSPQDMLQRLWTGTRAALLGVYDEPHTLEWQEAWAITEEVILRSERAVRVHGGRFIVLLVADSLAIAPEVSLGPELAAQFDITYPNRRLAEFCRRHGIICLDALPWFLERKVGLSYPYFSWEYDGHYSSLGHSVMAEFLLQSELWN